MTGEILNAVLFSAAPAIGMAAGGALAVWSRPGKTVRSYIQHLAAGIVFAAVGVEILPDLMRRGHPFAVSCGFALGVGAMLAIRASSRRAESSSNAGPGLPWGLIGAVSVDIFVDGILVGVGFVIGARQGILLTVALTGCAISLGLATAVSVLRLNTSSRRAIAVTSAIAGTTHRRRSSWRIGHGRVKRRMAGCNPCVHLRCIALPDRRGTAGRSP